MGFPTGGRNQDGSDCFTALDEAGYSYGWCGENIAAGQQTAAQAVDSWMHSSGHRKNILTKQFTRGAIGCYVAKNSEYRIYWVQMFTD